MDAGVLIAVGVVAIFLAAAAVQHFFETRLGYLALGAGAACVAVFLLVTGIAKDSGGHIITAFTFSLIAGALLLHALAPARKK